MIVDLARFVETERPQWSALEKSLDWLATGPERKLTIEEAQRFHELFRVERGQRFLGRFGLVGVERRPIDDGSFDGVAEPAHLAAIN